MYVSVEYAAKEQIKKQRSMELNTFELLEKLSQKPSNEIQFALCALLMQGKIEYVDLSKAYVSFLESAKEDSKLKLSDANSCTLSLLTHISKENESNKSSIHWALYNLNESKQFQMQDLNEKFGYDKDEDCKLSFYWRETKSRMK